MTWGLRSCTISRMGLRMAQKSGLSEKQALKAIFTHCGKCKVGMPTGGVQAYLKSRDGPEAIYWCRACVAVYHFERTNTPLTKRQFKNMCVAVTGRSFLSA